MLGFNHVALRYNLLNIALFTGLISGSFTMIGYNDIKLFFCCSLIALISSVAHTIM